MPTILVPGNIKRGIDGLPFGKSTIPLDYVIDAVRHAKNSTELRDKFLIIDAKTGSGKSVNIPPKIYLSLAEGRNVCATQPRTISAEMAAREVPEHYPLIFGKTVGFQSRSLTIKPPKGLIYMTAGTLQQQLKTMAPEQIGYRYSYIIIDEAHDRSIDTDVTLRLLKGTIESIYKEAFCPVVLLMSATLEIDRFSKYFGTKNVISIAGQSYPIQDHYGVPVQDAIVSAAEKAHELHNSKPLDGDILVFVATNKDIKTVQDLLEQQNDTAHPMLIIALSSEVNTRGEPRIERNLEDLHVELGGKKYTPVRRIIVSTNVAETSVTIPSLKYIVDTGLHFSPEWNPAGYTYLSKKPVSRDMAMQRRGRAGRVGAGEWHPLYDKKCFDAMQGSKYPEVFTNEITQLLLALLIRDVDPNSLMDPIPVASYRYSYSKLYSLGAIYDPELHRQGSVGSEMLCNAPFNPKVSRVGILLDKFRRVSIDGARAILAAYERKSNPLTLVTIVAMLDQPIQVITKNYTGLGIRGLEDDNMIEMAIIIERVLQCGLDNKKIEALCDKLAINYGSVLSAIVLRDEILEDLHVIGLPIYYNGMGISQNEYSLSRFAKHAPETFIDEVLKIKLCLLDGYRTNLCERRGSAFYHKYIGKMYGPSILSSWIVTGSVISFGSPQFSYYTGIPAELVDDMR